MRTSWRGIVVIGSILAAGLLVGSIKAAPPELTEKQAVERAAGYLTRAGLPPPNPIVPVPPIRGRFSPAAQAPTKAAIRARLTTAPYGIRIWEIQFYGDYRVELDSRTGDLFLFENTRKSFELVYRLNRTGQRKIRTREEARARCLEVATALGLPARASLDKLELKNSKGFVNAHFTEKPHGYPFLRGGNGTSVSLDPQDGMPERVGNHWRTQADRPNRRISEAKAVETANREYARLHVRSSGFHRGTYSPARPPRLGFVVPNGLSAAGMSRPPADQPARLAWVVLFGEESVWVEAETGKVVGAEIFK